MEYEILLLNISRDNSGYASCFNDSIGQYLIAAYLRKHDFVAQVYSGNVQDCRKIITEELNGNHVKIIGFYAAADNIRIVSHVIKWVKENFSAITIVGGPQAIALDKTFFQNTDNDFAIVGEGEIPMLKLLSYIVDQCGEIKKIPSIKYIDKKAGDFIWNQCDDAIITDLDSIPFPHMEDSLKGTLRQGSMAGIITGRGCPNHCAFCYEGANAKNVRLRSIPNVMDEIDYIIKNNPRLNYINVYDDTFTLNPNRILEFCKGMKERKLKWCCEGHVSFVVRHPDMLAIMVESGLNYIQFGIESGSDSVLTAYNKNTSKEMILECIKICKESGIHGITGNFIIGGAKETKQSIEESKQLAKEMINNAKGIIELNTVYFAPYPNTQMVNRPQEFEIEIDEELKDYNLNTMQSPVVKTKELTTQDIYQSKHEFDLFLAEEYQRAGLASTKKDIIQSLYTEGHRSHINSTWERIYLSHNHIGTFIKHLSCEEQIFNPDSYIIRTFEDFAIIDGKMVTDIGIFEGKEKELLLHATGIYNAKELAKKMSVTLDEIEKLYGKLNEKCLVYMSIW